jgi:hypothetical protein
MAKFALFCYLDAARIYNNSGRPVKRPWLFMDEGQVVVGQNVERIFQQASGSKVRIVYSLQDLASLDSRDAPNLSSTIWTCTQVKQAFGIVDEREAAKWIKLSGEETGYTCNYSDKVSIQEVVRSRLNQNAISAVNDTPGSSILYVTRDTGIGKFSSIPRQTWCPFPITEEEYQRRDTTPWPEISETHVQAGEAKTTVVNREAPLAVEQRGAEKYAAIEQLFSQVSKKSGRRPVISAGGE